MVGWMIYKYFSSSIIHWLSHMKPSSHGHTFTLLANCAGILLVTSGFPIKKAQINKLLSARWVKTPRHSCDCIDKKHVIAILTSVISMNMLSTFWETFKVISKKWALCTFLCLFWLVTCCFDSTFISSITGTRTKIRLSVTMIIFRQYQQSNPEGYW